MPSILIVEDEAIVGNDIQETLISLGYDIAGQVRTGESAILMAGEKSPDLVLMDIHLAGTMDGIDAAAEIHAKFGIPVIFLTAYADKTLLERAKVTEPYGYIVKPYDERGLHTTIEIALYKHRLESRLKESEATTRLMVNASQDLLYLVGADGTILVANEALAKQARMTTDTLRGTSAYDLVGKNVLTPKMACWQLSVKGESRITMEEQLNRNWYDVSIFPVYNSSGGAEKYAVSVRNITGKKVADEMMKNNVEHYRVLIEEAAEIVVMLNPDGSFSQDSPSFKRAIGWPANEVLKKSLFNHISSGDSPEARKVLSEVALHPGMTKPVRLKFEKRGGSFCIIKGIISNLSNNPFVGRIVLNGWRE